MRPEETLDHHIKSSWLSISRLYNQLSSKYHLTQAMSYVLMIIDVKKGTPATKIGPLMGTEATALSRLLKNMEVEGLIFRLRDERDRRKVRIFLTGKGLEKRKIAFSVVQSFNNKLNDRLSEKEIETFLKVINKVQLVVDQYKSN